MYYSSLSGTGGYIDVDADNRKKLLQENISLVLAAKMLMQASSMSMKKKKEWLAEACTAHYEVSLRTILQH